MNHDKFLKHVQEHGITRARITEPLNKIPADTVLWFGVDGNFLSTYNDNTGGKNEEFGYDFDYQWWESWQDDYTGEFILIPDDTGYLCDNYTWLKKGDLVDISPRLVECPRFHDWDERAKQLPGKKGLVIHSVRSYGYYIWDKEKNCWWNIPLIYVKPHVPEKKTAEQEALELLKNNGYKIVKE